MQITASSFVFCVYVCVEKKKNGMKTPHCEVCEAVKSVHIVSRHIHTAERV